MTRDNAELVSAVVSAVSDMMDAKFQTELQPIREEMADMKGEITGIKNDVTGMKGEIAGLKDRVTKIELHLENDINRNIRLLVENCIPAAQKFEKTTRQVQSMQQDIDVLKDVVAEHSRRLSRIS